MKKFAFAIFACLVLAWLSYFFASRFLFNYLSFSDAAKFADVARNMNDGLGYGSLFNFFGTHWILKDIRVFPASFTPPAMPVADLMFFKLFGVSDASVIAASLFFFWVSIVGTFLLANKMYGKLAGFLSAAALASNLDYWAYAKTAASETLFSAEVVFIPFLLLYKKKWSDISALLILVVMYFTRPQAFIFMAAYFLMWLLLRFSWKKSLIIFLALGFCYLFADKFILQRYNGINFFYSLTGRGEVAISQQGQNFSASDTLRGLANQTVSLLPVVKKTLNNLFNFYRLIPNIMSPYLFFLFALSLFYREKGKNNNIFKIVSFIAVLGSFMLPALTIPFFRYIHPVVPLIYILGVGFLIHIAGKVFEKKYGEHIATAILIIFVVALNVITAVQNYRFNSARTNSGKPPIYAKLAEVLRENTASQNFVVTNLDTWGSWYGERKTMWFPLEPKQLVNKESGKIWSSIDAIYLTSYLINDENYFMGDGWRQIFLNPESPDKWICDGCDRIATEFKLKGVYEVPASENYQKEDAKAVLLVKKTSI